MRTAAILPVKSFSRAKQRLGASVTDPLRLGLARAMVGDVLTALNECGSIELTVVVTREESVVAAASYLGAVVVPDTEESGQSVAVTLGIERAIREGVERVLCIPGDCPALDPSELDELLGDPADAGAVPESELDAARPSVTIVPDRHGTGTNGLLLAPPDAIVPSFGPDSFERHRSLARAAGARCEVAHPSSLLLDIDTGLDLAALRERLAGELVRAPRTRTVLASTAREEPAA